MLLQRTQKRPSRNEGSFAPMLLKALRELDRRLGLAADAIKGMFGPEASRDLFRGLHITPSEFDSAIARAPCEPLLGPLGLSGAILSPNLIRNTRLEVLSAEFGLQPLDLDILLIGLAPDIDARYERLYAFIQDDVGKKRPTLDLVLNLLCESTEDKLFRLRHFAADAPLIREGLIRVGAADGQAGGPRLSQSITVDDSVLRYLTDSTELDARLVAFCRCVPSLGGDNANPFVTLRGEHLARYIKSADEEEIRTFVQCAVRGCKIVFVDLELAPSTTVEWADVILLLFRESRLAGNALCFEHVDGFLQPAEIARFRILHERIESHSNPVFLTGEKDWVTPHGAKSSVITVALCPLPFELRAASWQQELAGRNVVVAPEVRDEVADLFIIGQSQIANAVTLAIHNAGQRKSEAPSREDLFEGARAQTRGQLGELAHRITTSADWDDIVLPADVMAQLRELRCRVAHRGKVLRNWGFGKKLDYGKGISALFAGPSGTGKTMAAGVIARTLGLDLYRVDLSRLISKYIGETAKNIASVFKENRVLLIDEADAIMGKRTEIRDAHDRYANQDVAFLLQCMETFEGLVILTSNLPGLIDTAFRRRLTMTAYFPNPDEDARRQLWQKVWPADAPLALDVDFGLLASQLKITGGVIKSAALGAAYLAAEDGPPIAMNHILQALRRELAAIGGRMPESLATCSSSTT